MNVADAAAELHQRTKRTWACIRAESQGRDWSNHPLPFQDLSRLEPLWLPCELPESSVAATEVLAGHVLAPAGALDLAGLAGLLCFSAGVIRFLQDVLFRAAPRPARCTRRRWTWSAAPWRPARRGGRLRAGRVGPALAASGGFRARLAASAAEPAIAWRCCAWCSPGSPGGRPGSTASVAGATCSGTRVRSWPTCWRWPRGPGGARVLLGFVDQEVSGLVGIGE